MSTQMIILPGGVVRSNDNVTGAACSFLGDIRVRESTEDILGVPRRSQGQLKQLGHELVDLLSQGKGIGSLVELLELCLSLRCQDASVADRAVPRKLDQVLV